MENKAAQHHTTDQVAGIVHETVEKAAQTAGQVEEYAREQASHADERVRQAAAQGRKQADDLLENANGYVRQNPVMALAIAFVAGLLFSWLRQRR